MGRRSLEWTRLGARLSQLCPEKFDEILEALRDTVAVHELMTKPKWVIGAVDGGQPKA